MIKTKNNVCIKIDESESRLYPLKINNQKTYLNKETDNQTPYSNRLRSKSKTRFAQDQWK